MKVATIVGARPQFIKAAAVSKELRKFAQEVLIHTGQHYDHKMSDLFFRELSIPESDYNLRIGSGTHGMQTGRMLESIEEVLMNEKPDWVLVYGDTNSTLAGALAAAKLHIPVAHIEAGLRSYNFSMPEEINRRLTDQLSTLLFCPTVIAVNNLLKEGYLNIVNSGNLITTELPIKNTVTCNPVVANVGDVMNDIFTFITRTFKEEKTSRVLSKYCITKKEYALATIHRAENTDNKGMLANIIQAFSKLEMKVLWPLHPRTKKQIMEFGLERELKATQNIFLINPVGYAEMMLLLNHAFCLVTDSGGLQKEACMAGVPCYTCREETEWQETLQNGSNVLVGLGAKRLLKFIRNSSRINKNNSEENNSGNPYGNGNAAQLIASILTKW